MRFTLRVKFYLLLLPLVLVVLLLVYMLNMPYRLLKDMLVDVGYDVEQIIEAESFLRFVYRQQNELLHNITTEAAEPHAGHRGSFHKGATGSLEKWKKAFANAAFPEQIRRRLSANLQTVASSYNQINALSDAAIRLAREGRTQEALLQHDRIEDIIAGIITPVSEDVVRELDDETRHNIPFIMGSFEHMAFVRSGVAAAMEKVEMEVGHTLTVQRFMRLVYGCYQGAFGPITGNTVGSSHQKETYRRMLRGLMDRWALDVSLAGPAEKERMEKVFREGQRILNQMDIAGNRIELLSRQGRKDAARDLLIKEIDSTDTPFLGETDAYIRHETAEMHEALEGAYHDISKMQMIIAGLSAAVLLLWAAVIAVISRSVINPVVRLRQAAVLMGEGDFAAAVGRAPSDEVGELMAAFEDMRLKLKSAMDDLAEEVQTRKRAEGEKEKIISELKNALAQVRTLSGLLPICASCKKIRDDKGYWTQVETYVTDHTMAEFSHGLCPDCAQKIYRDLEKLKEGSAG